MMIPMLSEAQIKRMTVAYDLGVESYELAQRFGVRDCDVPRIVRGEYVPLMYHVNDGSITDDDVLSPESRIMSCKLHLLDLVSVYRPEVIQKLKLKKSRRRPNPLPRKEQDCQTFQIPEELPEGPILPMSATRRSARIFLAGLRYFNMTAAEMSGKMRVGRFPRCRQILMFVIYRECSKFESTPSIGRIFDKDHSTVVHAIHKVEKLLEDGDEFVTAAVAALREVK